MALVEFLKTNEKEILTSIEEMSSALAGVRPASEPPRLGLPVFFEQLVFILEHAPVEPQPPGVDEDGMAREPTPPTNPQLRWQLGDRMTRNREECRCAWERAAITRLKGMLAGSILVEEF